MTAAQKPLRIALMGSRGIPARYGGYETLLEEISVRLKEMGYDVTVYCRAHYTRRDEKEHQGVRLVVLPTIRSKHLDTPVHTLLTGLHALGKSIRGQRYDAALVVNSANALFLPLLRLARTPTALHVDGIEKKRAKWGLVGRTVYALSERLACRWPDVLVSDAAVIHDHYEARYGAPSWLITYGVEPRPPLERGVLEKLGLRERQYFLYVSRFEPENNPHRVVEAYRDVGGELPLVMVGDAPYSNELIDRMKQEADSRVLFPGAIYGDGYRELLSHALAYVQATEVGGTHPALVEAMGYGNCVVVNGTPENVEAAGEGAPVFDAHQPATLARILDKLRQDPEQARRLGEEAAQRAHERFSWDAVSQRYAQLFDYLASL